MYRYYVLFAVVVIACASRYKSILEKRINKDIAGIDEQMIHRYVSFNSKAGFAPFMILKIKQIKKTNRRR
jgi:hypothetical protein